MDVKLGLSLWG